MRSLIVSPLSIFRILAERSLRTAASILLLFAILWTALAATSEVRAQEPQPGIVAQGDLVISGFSGKVPPPANPPLPAGTSELDETLINVGGASIKILDVSNPGGPPEGQVIDAPAKFQVPAGEIGQVFGLAIDNANPRNIYATATPVHGLQIVLPDSDGDGRPERLKLGQPGAQWMDGQFGIAKGGGPGSVWKIDGTTGAVTLFANIGSPGAPNGGSGLGNIAYDDRHKQFYVSDPDTGLIHRLDMNGTDLGTFDHGVQGRPANGLDALADDPANKLDITSPAFDSEDPDSWGFTDTRRRIWGLAYHGGRLYYAVADGPQVWSVGVAEDGNFAGDPRWELDVSAGPKRHPVSDIAFAKGQMILAQRGGIASRYDYSQYHSPRKNRVLRYRLEAPDDPATPSRWVAEPEEYATGFPATHRNTSGGVAVGYGYKKNDDGSYGFGSCDGTLWSSGDALRDNPVHQGRLAQGGPFTVHGIQGNAMSLVRPQNEPPWSSYFVDYDGQFDDPEASGHVGDVEIAVNCWKPKAEKADLRVIKRAIPERCDASGDCTFALLIENVGGETYSGPLLVRDTADGGAVLVNHSPPDWQCDLVFDEIQGTYECSHGPVQLAPGQSISLELTFTLPGAWDQYVYRNCAELTTPGIREDARRYNNRSCDYVATGAPGTPGAPGGPFYGPDIQVEKYALDATCDVFGNCPFVVIITNVGTADYNGPLSISDVVTEPGTSLVNWFPQPQWICAAGGAPQSYDCTHPAPVTLSPGESREIILVMQGPPLVAGFTHVRNCAQFEWQGFARDFNPGNEFACAEIYRYPPGHPGAVAILEVNKKAAPACVRPGGAGNPWFCIYRVDITNTGGIPYDQPLEFIDEPVPHPGYTLAAYNPTPPWTCAPGVGGGGPQTCTSPAVAGGLLPGETLEVQMVFQLPAGTPVPSVERNCARLMWDSDGDGVAEPHEACADALVCDAGVNCPPDLALLKFAPAAPCNVGDPCPFDFTVQNISGVNFPGPLTLDEIPETDLGPPTFVPAGWVCVPAGGTYNCTNPIAIPPGGTAGWQVSFNLPPDYPAPTFENCARTTVVDVWAPNNEDCAIAQVPAPDLAPWSPSSCTRGIDCPLDVSIDNRGSRPFRGAAGLKGTLSPAVQIKSITSNTPGMTCRVTGVGTYVCNAPRLEIAPHGAATLQFTAVIPADFPHDAITHTKEMVWPDRKVKDKKPENDKHVSTIDILGPKEPSKPPPPPPPPPPPAGRPDLAVVKTANQAACRAGSSRCGFTVTVTNAGTAPYSGPIDIADTISPSAATLVSSGPPPWRCQGRRGEFGCFHPPTTLQPGQSKILSLTFRLPGRVTGAVNNCVLLRWGGAPQTRGGVRDVQGALAARGFNPGPADGKAGRKTVDAIRAYQSQNGLPVTGRIDQALLASLFAQPGGSDPNPANDRACVVSSIIGQPPPPPPPPCTGGQFRNNYGACVCPANKPVWTGARCIPRPPQQCTGGRLRNNQGVCVCPASRPVWTGQNCVPRGFPPPGCAPPRVKNRAGQCVCPSNKPVWTGKACIARPPQQCSGGRVRNNKGQCVCPASKPTWTGQICIPKITICSGGRVFSLKQRKCVCPANRPVWSGSQCNPAHQVCSGGRIYSERLRKCVCPANRPVWSGSQCNPAHQVCSGGRIYSERSRKCVCPSNKPFWNGSFCTQHTTNPGNPPPPVHGCTGGRIRTRSGGCACPSNKPTWTGQSCVPARLQLNPNLQRLLPQIR